MKNQIRPADAAYIETDGTYWKQEKGIWMWWRTGWGWCQYVGKANNRLFDKFTQL